MLGFKNTVTHPTFPAFAEKAYFEWWATITRYPPYRQQDMMSSSYQVPVNFRLTFLKKLKALIYDCFSNQNILVL